ncbi:MAG: hypothetical protein M1820_006635 [Bogoriella megaspora]|nr:MAG: hypothetical protein M1820_006635 [Bogoriella megaspora]
MSRFLRGTHSVRLSLQCTQQTRCVPLKAGRYAFGDNLQRKRGRSNAAHSNIAQPGEQANPLEGYYADQPSKKVQPATRTKPEPPPSTELPKTDKEETLSKARVVFGSRLAGPAERRDELNRASTKIAGVLVPPRPSEPDNCCMSGCVNCVWDRYRDELEEWASASAEARRRMQAQRDKVEGSEAMLQQSGMPTHVATSMDDDGGGSETNWSQGLDGDGRQGDLFGDIPVGIREFMRTEKMLKQKHLQQESAGG